MRPSIALRVAAILSLLFALGHTLGGVRHSWSPVGENPVLESMRTVHFPVGGVSRSFLDFYLGFGFLLSVYLLLQAVLLWLLAGVAREQAAITRPFVLAFTVANAVNCMLCWRFLFAVPAVFTAVVTIAIALALLPQRR